MFKGIAVLREHQMFFHLTSLSGLLAESQAAAGQFNAALATLDEAFANTDRTGLRWVLPELHRERAEIILRRQPSDVVVAEHAFERALEEARNQQARSFRVRAALGLAKLYSETDRRLLARELLTSVLAESDQSPEFPEFEQGRLLLERLQQN